MNSILKFDGEIRVANNTILDTIQAFNNLIEAGTLLDLSSNGLLLNLNFINKLKKVNGEFKLK